MAHERCPKCGAEKHILNRCPACDFQRNKMYKDIVRECSDVKKGYKARCSEKKGRGAYLPVIDYKTLNEDNERLKRLAKTNERFQRQGFAEGAKVPGSNIRKIDK